MKICTGCKQEKDETLFNFRNKEKGIRFSYCAECGKLKTRKHYQNNKQYYIDKAKTHYPRYREEIELNIVEFFKKNPCIDCMETNILLLDFDHMRDKEFGIAQLISKRASWTTIKREIDKCVVRCANCHRIKTAKENNSWRLKYMVG